MCVCMRACVCVCVCVSQLACILALQALNAITQIIEECWHDSADTRLTALRVRKNLQRAIEASEKIATR